MRDLLAFALAAVAVYIGFWTWPCCDNCRRAASGAHLQRSSFTSWRLVFSCKSHRLRVSRSHTHQRKT